MDTTIRYVLVVLIVLDTVSGFPNGAPEGSCTQPVPIHSIQVNGSHTGLFLPHHPLINPYQIEAASSNYTPGQRVSVTIHSPRFGIPFRGFFIQMLSAGTPLTSQWRTTHGRWFNTSLNERPLWCASFLELGINRRLNLIGGITHTNNMDKMSVTVDWIAPSQPVGDVQVVASIVRQYSTFWIDVRSQPITLYQAPAQVSMQAAQQPTPPREPTVLVGQQTAQASQGLSLGSQPNLVQAPGPVQSPFSFGVPPSAGNGNMNNQLGAQNQGTGGNRFGPQSSFQAPGFAPPAQG